MTNSGSSPSKQRTRHTQNLNIGSQNLCLKWLSTITPNGNLRIDTAIRRGGKIIKTSTGTCGYPYFIKRLNDLDCNSDSSNKQSDVEYKLPSEQEFLDLVYGSIKIYKEIFNGQLDYEVFFTRLIAKNDYKIVTPYKSLSISFNCYGTIDKPMPITCSIFLTINGKTRLYRSNTFTKLTKNYNIAEQQLINSLPSEVQPNEFKPSREQYRNIIKLLTSENPDKIIPKSIYIGPPTRSICKGRITSSDTNAQICMGIEHIIWRIRFSPILHFEVIGTYKGNKHRFTPTTGYRDFIKKWKRMGEIIYPEGSELRNAFINKLISENELIDYLNIGINFYKESVSDGFNYTVYNSALSTFSDNEYKFSGPGITLRFFCKNRSPNNGNSIAIAVIRTSKGSPLAATNYKSFLKNWKLAIKDVPKLIDSNMKESSWEEQMPTEEQFNTHMMRIEQNNTDKIYRPKFTVNINANS